MNWLERLLGETQLNLLRLLRRSQQSITSLAAALRLTDNAVRTHVAALGRDGLVMEVGTQRDTGGKPARLYALTEAGEELFPKGYAPVLNTLIEEIVTREGKAHAVELLGAVGRSVGAKVVAPADPAARVSAAAGALNRLGGELEVSPTPDGWRLQGVGCPLSAVTSRHAEACELARALIAEVTRRPVTECCEHGARPRCAFQVQA